MRRRIILASIGTILVLAAAILAAVFFLSRPQPAAVSSVLPTAPVPSTPTDVTASPEPGRLAGILSLLSIRHDRLPVSAEKAASAPLRLLFFGDLMLDRHVGERLAGHDIGYLLLGLTGDNGLLAGSLATGSPVFPAPNLISANLEGAVTDSGKHYSPAMSYDFAFAPARIAELKTYGFDFFNLANNHISDQGQRGLIETRKNLDALGLSYSGDMDATVSSSSLVVASRAGQRVALIGLSMVYHDFDLPAAVALVAAARAQADLVIVNIHWGTEYVHNFNRHQQAVGRALIDAGADIIIGHHPHVVQGMEVYKGRPIFYSLGNFIFDQYFSSDTQHGLAVGLDIDDTGWQAFLFPLQSKQSAPSLMAGPDKEDFLAAYIGWSATSSETATALAGQRVEIRR